MEAQLADLSFVFAQQEQPSLQQFIFIDEAAPDLS
jgi:hypothetical protein